MKIFFDGGCRPLPAGMATALVARGRARVERGLGPGSSMEAEWLALIAGMRLAIELGAADTILLGDAAAVIAQAGGQVRVPPAFSGYARTFHDLPPPAGRVRLRYVKRTQNLAGIVLDRDRR